MSTKIPVVTVQPEALDTDPVGFRVTVKLGRDVVVKKLFAREETTEDNFNAAHQFARKSHAELLWDAPPAEEAEEPAEPDDAPAQKALS